MVDSLEDHFNNRIKVINQGLLLCGKTSPEHSGNLIPIFNSICMETTSAKSSLNQVEKVLGQNRDLLEQLTALKTLSAQISSVYGILQKNLPEPMRKKEDIKPQSSPHPPQPSHSSKQPDHSNISIPQVEVLTLPEYETIPKYMKGRMTYEAINQGIKDLNDALNCKYTFFGRGFKATAPLAEKKKYQAMKKLENKDTKGVYFVVYEDLKNYSAFKTEAGRRTFFTILRHGKKVREIRGPGSIVRYAVINNK